MRADVPHTWRFAMKVQELYASVTQTIINDLEEGVASWTTR